MWPATRITADLQGRRTPWWLTAGQLHYLGSHHPDLPASIWGGCFALDRDHARLLGLDFDSRLGRVGNNLASAEDTTLVQPSSPPSARPPPSSTTPRFAT